MSLTPHEAAHARTAYCLGFSCTLYQMWVNPDAADATPGQVAIISLLGPVFSLYSGWSHGSFIESVGTATGYSSC